MSSDDDYPPASSLPSETGGRGLARKRKAATASASTTKKAKAAYQKRPNRMPALDDDLSPMADPESLQANYEDLVALGRARVCRLDRTTWAVEAVDVLHATVAPIGPQGWLHVHRETLATMEQVFSCNCSGYKTLKRCIHADFLSQSQSNNGADDDVIDAHAPVCELVSFQPAKLLQPETTPGLSASTLKKDVMFSVLQDGRGTERCFVHFSGVDWATSSWNCGKCKSLRAFCRHNLACMDYVRRYGVLSELMGDMPEFSGEEQALFNETYIRDRAAKGDRRAHERERAVSHQAIPPPPAFRIDSDTIPETTTLESWPDHLLFDGSIARCIDGHVHEYDAKDLRFMPAVIYGLTRPHRVQVQVTPCASPGCGRWAGPDLGTSSLFNHSNSKIFSHQLLNTFSSLMFRVGSTFHGFWMHTKESYPEGASFCTAEEFRDVWFAFIDLQVWENDFECPHCGSYPKEIVIDAVTAGFPRNNRLPSLCPPTRTDNQSPIRPDVKYVKDLPAISNPSLRRECSILLDERKRAEGIVSDRQRVASKDKANPLDRARVPIDADRLRQSSSDGASSKRQKTVELDSFRPVKDRDRLADVAKAVAQLAEDAPALAKVFGIHVGLEGAKSPEDRKLYFELISQLLAHESTLQFSRPCTWPHLDRIARGDDDGNLLDYLSKDLPAFAAVAKVEMCCNKTISQDLRALARWIVERAKNALATVMSMHKAEEPCEMVQKDWRETGAFYPMPQIRRRPRYPGISTDGAIDRSAASRGIGCSKFYERPGQGGLTGGIQVLWCGCGIAGGFHCIEDGEGRDDPFSAIYTRYPTAPDVVVYDFACALGPYCLLREADFFQNTLFVVDKFHSTGHTRCSKAAFLSTYEPHNAHLRQLNSSAAECGNQGIRRISKQVSYMLQAHAIKMIKVFLSMWNRQKIQTMQRSQATAIQRYGAC